MTESKKQNKAIGCVGVITGILCLTGLLVIDSAKLIIPISDSFLVRYFLYITILNAGVYFLVAGILAYNGNLLAKQPNHPTEYRKLKAKGFLFSAVVLSPFLVSLFTTIFTVAHSPLWKVLGACGLICVCYQVYSNVVVFAKRANRSP